MIYGILFAKYCDLGNLKLRCRVYKGQPLVPVLKQINPIRSNPVHYFRIYFNDVHRSTLKPTKCSRFFTLTDQNSLCISLPTQSHYMHRTFRLPSFNHNIFIWRSFKNKTFFTIQISAVSSYILRLRSNQYL
jgi:hypothetical protein